MMSWNLALVDRMWGLLVLFVLSAKIRGYYILDGASYVTFNKWKSSTMSS